MKVYRNSIYIFLALSLISFMLAYRLSEKDIFFSNVMLGVFGSSLITLFSTIIFYLNEKEKIIVSLGIKCVTLYFKLHNFLALLNSEDDNFFDYDGRYGLKILDKAANDVIQNSIKYELQNYSGFWSNQFFGTVYTNEEIKLISSLWTIEENLVNGLPEAINSLNKNLLAYRVASLEKDFKQQSEEKESCLNIINDLKTNIPLQIDFVDKMIDNLFKYKKFNSTWDNLKKQINQKNGIQNEQG